MAETEWQCPADEPGAPCINNWMYAFACEGARRRISPDVIRVAIYASLPPTRGPKGPREVERQVERAYGVALSTTGNATSRKANADPFNADLLIEQAKQIDHIITSDWLRDRSPVSVDNVSPSRFLDIVFAGLPGYAVAKNSDHSDGFLYRPGDTEAAQRLNVYARANECGAWFYTCPMIGERNPAGRAFYADALIADYPHLLLESDKDGYDQCWLRMIVQQPERIVALYTSGNVSTHALIRVNARSKVEFDSIAADYEARYAPLGACPGSLTATRATRLPGVMRNGKPQQLLYLNPNADSTPILHREPFEPLF
jgi:hypothetical protein